MWSVKPNNFWIHIFVSTFSCYRICTAVSMISRLRAKSGSEQLTVTQGNFAEVAVQQEFALVYVVFNTLFSLSTQEEKSFTAQSGKHISLSVNHLMHSAADFMPPRVTLVSRARYLTILGINTTINARSLIVAVPTTTFSPSRRLRAVCTRP